MSLQAAIEAELPFLRSQAESRMFDTFNISYPTGAVTTDASGTETRSLVAEFATVGRVRTGMSVRGQEVGGRTAALTSRELHIPVTSPVVRPGAVAVCTAVHVTSDPTLLGARLSIAGAAPGSQTTARRLQVEEVVS
ncbi:MAG: DUF6093 family protein [Actinomycetia bacterium]|nr:DUF6093 family protein [Actinomycetes bacterium]